MLEIKFNINNINIQFLLSTLNSKLITYFELIQNEHATSNNKFASNNYCQPSICFHHQYKFNTTPM